VSPRLPVVSGPEAVEALSRVGFLQVSQRGSHAKLRNDLGRTAIVPLHRELAPGTLRSILRQAGLSLEDFARLL
jgi:predicted RNA binding protein YcfA (HicA-like mRNA interferase family)